MDYHLWDRLAEENDTKIVYLVIDGVGGLAVPERGQSELQAAHLPNLDDLAARSETGLLEIVGPGITPGSGPGHLSLFGYDSLEYTVGRGVLAALGVDFPLQPADVPARVNFATLDEQGNVVDRRAGRISSETNAQLCAKIRENVHVNFDGEIFFQTVKGHRALLVLRGEGLSGDLADTDPQETGVPPLTPRATSPAGERTAAIVREFVEQVREALADEHPANMILLRGFDRYEAYPSISERFKLRGLSIADYPMYRGVTKLIGMNLHPVVGDMAGRFDALDAAYGEDYDFYFLHIKQADARGEDGDFDGKVRVLEAVDALVPRLTALGPDVLVVTGDHSTPSALRAHSWHPVPVILHSRYARVDGVDRFDEYACARGSLGLRPGVHLMGLALAHAGRLAKYGA
ncbi:MAG: 2,3-bisphosphoglycerate-independent phosphoglycerate mutase [Anaerolineae bacterium]